MQSARAPGTVAVTVLGEFAARRNGDRRRLPIGAARLLSLLVVRDRPVLRTRVAVTLWADQDDDRAAASVRTALWRLRHELGDIVICTGSELRIDPAVDTDIGRVRRLADRLRSSDTPASTQPAAEAPADHHLPFGWHLDDFTGELLPDWDEDWLLPERERIRQTSVHALESICRELTAAGQTDRAIDAGLAAVSIDPLRESARRVLIEAHLAEGNVSEAHRDLARYRHQLAAELGIEPSAELVDLVHGRSPLLR